MIAVDLRALLPTPGWTLPADAPARLGAPVTPDADEARRAAERELSRAEYHAKENVLLRLWKWILNHIVPEDTPEGLRGWFAIVVIVLLVLILVAILVFMLRRVSRVHRARTKTVGLFDDDDRDAASLAAAATGAAARGDWDTAVVERFRAIIRSLDERGAIEDYPGMTAHEAAATAAPVLPAQARDIVRAGTLFDAVRYGEVVASREEDAWMLALARSIEEARLDVPPPESPSATAPGDAREYAR